MAIEPFVFLHGQHVPLDEARISPFDRGFLFGDGLYEGVKILGRTPLFFDRHLARLAVGLVALRIEVDLGRLDRDLRDLVAANRTDSGFLYLQITRGAMPERRHLPAPGLVPTVFAFIERRGFPPPAGAPQAAVIREDFRWRHCDWKVVSLVATTLGKLAAADAGADELLWRDADGRLLEGGNTNVFVRTQEGLETAPLGPNLLPGVTRGLVLELAQRRGLPVVEQAPTLAARAGWREIFVTGTVTGVQAVTRLDGERVGDGSVGEWTHLLAGDLDLAERAEAERGS